MQERQFPQSGPARLVHDETRARRLWRAHRIKAAAGISVVTLSLFALGCPQGADLENPNFYCKPEASVIDANHNVTGCAGGPAVGGSGSTAGSGSGGSGMMTASCETGCMTAIINAPAGCKLCHTSNPATRTSGTLDFETAGYSARLKDKPAEHSNVPAGSTCPMGDKYIDSAAPANSWLLKKITGMQGSCGTVMPSTGMLGQADVMCVTTYVNCVAMSGAPAGGGGTASGGAATGGGGSGGAATGGGGSGGAATGGSGGSGGAKGGSGGTGGV